MSPNKYGAQPTEVDGIKFASKAEGRRYAELRMLEAVGEIFDLECHPRFEVRSPAGGLMFTYYGDFSYNKWGKLVIEDVKSKPTKTPVYRLKKKILRLILGIEITEVEM